MNVENEDNKINICPYCAEEIKQAAIKCKYCGEFLVDDSTPSEAAIAENKPRVQSKRKMKAYALLLGGAFLHVMFCSESPLIFISASKPLASLAGSLGYSIPGMVISTVFIAPIVNHFLKDKSGEGFLKGFTLKSTTIALYVGAAVRFLFFVNKA